MKAGLAGVILLALAWSAPLATAQALDLDSIPKNVAGAWIVSGGGSLAACTTPSLVVTTSDAKDFTFSFSSPRARERRLLLGVPMPQVIGAPPAASFEPPRAPEESDEPRLASGLEISMPNTNTMVVAFMGSREPRVRFDRCAVSKVG